jgi:hypothetical protein
MVGHGSATIVLAFSLLGADPPQVAAPAGNPAHGEVPQRPESEQVRSEPLVPPAKYLRAGATLFNQGKYTLAGKYLEAAYRYRDRLSRNEQIVLDVYLDELVKYRNQVAGRALADPGVKPAATYVVDPPAPGAQPPADPFKAARTDAKTQRTSATPPDGDAHPHAPAVAGDTGQAAGTDKPASSTGPRPSPLRNALRFETTDVKQKARWLLQCAREETFHGRFDEARQYVEEARALNVKWGRLEETPDKVVKAIEKARARAAEAKANAKSDSSDSKPKTEP